VETVAERSIGVAVVGAGMAGRSHAAGYRAATTVFDNRLPAVRLVAIADTVAARQAMVDAMRRTGLVGAVGYTLRRLPAVNAIREQLRPGSLGEPFHFDGHYWCDYGCNPHAPMSWRYQGGPGSGALADVGTHLVDLAEFLCGPIQTVSGASLRTM
jgi:predicted dehydrogenase